MEANSFSHLHFQTEVGGQLGIRILEHFIHFQVPFPTELPGPAVRHIRTLDLCLLVTDHVRSIRKGNVFSHVCPFVHRKGMGGATSPG